MKASTLIKMFPYFFDKSRSSNFYKSQKITANLLNKVDQSLFEVNESFKLKKNCLIWKEQNSERDYHVNFFACYPNLKSVKCYKNNRLIYMESYEEEDNQSNFYFTYSCSYSKEIPEWICNNCGTIMYSENIPAECSECGSTQINVQEKYYYNDNLIITDNSIPYNLVEGEIDEEDDSQEELVEVPIIPEDKFHIYIETYDELTIEKGFPENDILRGDIYDHDESLDEIGIATGVQRKKYIETTHFANTEPPFNNRGTEDDYHYMNRIIEYNQRIHDTPLPVLEIWKLYGLPAVMLNRERLLLKWFDETKHPFNESTGHVMDWSPMAWEHKDGFADKCGADNKGQYFFVVPSTNMPKKWSDVTFRFRLLNNIAEELEEDFTVDIYRDGSDTPTKTGHDGKTEYLVTSDTIDDSNVNIFRFIAKNSENEVIGDETVDITVKGCLNGDWYVSSTGDDNNGDGSSESPFLTLDKALQNITNTKNVIVVQGGVDLINPSIVNDSCTVLGCGNAVISNDVSNKFFRIVGNKNITLSLLDITLDANGAVSYVKSSDYINNNKSFSNYVTVLVHGGTPVLTFNVNKESYYYDYDNIIVTGSLTSKEGNPIKNVPLSIIFNDTPTTGTTDSNGEFSIVVPISNVHSDIYDLDVLFAGSSSFSTLSDSTSVNIYEDATIVPVSYGSSVDIESSGHTSGESVKFYSNGTLLSTETADSSGVATFTCQTPPYGITCIYTSDDGTNVDQEWRIETTLKISELGSHYLITNVSIENNKLYIYKQVASEFRTLRSLNGVVNDLSIDNKGVITISRFNSKYTDSTILDSDEIYPEDFEEIGKILTSLSIDNSTGVLECTRIGGLGLE